MGVDRVVEVPMPGATRQGARHEVVNKVVVGRQKAPPQTITEEVEGEPLPPKIEQVVTPQPVMQQVVQQPVTQQVVQQPVIQQVVQQPVVQQVAAPVTYASPQVSAVPVQA